MIFYFLVTKEIQIVAMVTEVMATRIFKLNMINEGLYFHASLTSIPGRTWQVDFFQALNTPKMQK